mmetsp:Transcript_20817/g.46208  ORF Transcript_20817/g.46208 Transcript_20817/m.46208 type:complete len:357 (-) Transcript_20817:44-1114(-)
MRVSPATTTIQLPRLYLGTMTFAWGQTSSYVDDKVAGEILGAMMDFCPERPMRIDTARIYAGGNSEVMLGRVLRSLEGESPIIGSKAHPSQPDGLSPAGIQAQLEASLDAVGAAKFGEFYLHQPDTENPLLGSLEALHDLVNQGKVEAIGMSNYHVSEVRRAFDLCEENGLHKPKVYQGLYNPLNRKIEDHLLPLLREEGCSFVAYNPLAAGLLTGKHTSGGDVKEGRFKDNPNYLPRFYTPSHFAAVDIIQNACVEANISMVEASYRWLLRHSALARDDGLLLGASDINQLRQNLNACKGAEAAELPQSMLDAFDAAYQIVAKDNPFPYWRSYSSDMPDRESLDQGASYSAAKAK